MTRSGSPATVIKKSAKAGPKATKVHPKNTAAPIAGQLGAGRRPGQERQMGGAHPPGSPRGVATRPREGRGAMSPPGPGEGEGGAPKPQILVRATSSTEAEEGTNPCRSPLATAHLIPAPPPGQWKTRGAGRGRDAGPAGSCSPPALLNPQLGCWAWLKPQRELAETGPGRGMGLRLCLGCDFL